MTRAADDARAVVAAAAGENGSAAALRALTSAAVWAVEAITTEAAPNADTPLPERGSAALRMLIGLDEALTAMSAMEAVVDGMVAVALPGEAVEDYLRQSLADLARLRTDSETVRKRAEELSGRESEIRALVQRHARLRDQVGELRRLQQLGDALEELAGQQSAIDARMSVLQSTVGSAEERLRRSTSELVTLTEDMRRHLASQNQRLLRQLEDEHTALITAEAENVRLTHETSIAETRLRELEEIRGGQLDILRAHARADESVARALPDIEAREAALPVPIRDGAPARVTRILERVDLLLNGVDSALTEALAAADAAAPA